MPRRVWDYVHTADTEKGNVMDNNDEIIDEAKTKEVE